MVSFPFFAKETKTTAKSFAIGKKTDKEMLRSINEAFRGLSKNPNKQLQSFANEYGLIEHPFDYTKVTVIAKEYGPVAGIIKKYVDYTVSRGMFIQCVDEACQQVIEDFIDTSQLRYHTARWLKQALIKGFSPMEIGTAKNADGIRTVAGVKVWDADNVFVAKDKHGQIIAVYQLKNNKMSGKVTMDDMIKFNPEDMLLLNIDQGADDTYGYGIVYPNLKTIQMLLNCEHDMQKLIERKANSPIHVQMGYKEKDIVPAEEDITSMKTSLEDLRNDQEWVTSDQIQMKVLDFGNIGDKFQPTIDHYMNQLCAGTQVPRVLLGEGNIPEGLADVQMQAFLMNIQSVQEEIARIYEDHLFPRVLQAAGLDEKVNVVWGEQTPEEKSERITQITNLLNNVYLSSALRVQLEKELASLMGLDESLIITPAQKTEALMDQKQPAVPGQNRALGERGLKIIDDRCNCTNKVMTKEEQYYFLKDTYVGEAFATEHPDATVQEWVGFNIDSFIADILAVIKQDNFEALKGLNAEEIARGKLSESQIRKLKHILETAFKEGKTIRWITDMINQDVGLRDLKGVTKNGNEFTIPASVRAPIIARTETTRMGAEGAVKNYIKNDIPQVKYLAVLDSRTSKICEDLNGKIFDAKQASGIIPQHPYCRSTFVPITQLGGQ